MFPLFVSVFYPMKYTINTKHRVCVCWVILSANALTEQKSLLYLQLKVYKWSYIPCSTLLYQYPVQQRHFPTIAGPFFLWEICQTISLRYGSNSLRPGGENSAWLFLQSCPPDQADMLSVPSTRTLFWQGDPVSGKVYRVGFPGLRILL